MVIERGAGGDHVNDRQAVVRDGGLQNGLKLFLVAVEGTGHIGGPPSQTQRAAVERGQVVDDTGLQLGAKIGSRRELAFGESVDAVVLDDIDKRQIPAEQV